MVRCVVLLLVLSGCRFDASGGSVDVVDGRAWRETGTHLPDVQPADADLGPPIDGGLDTGPLDSLPHDSVVPDGGPVTPINVVSLGQAFVSTQVVCVDKSGKVYATTTAVADSATVKFFDGQVTLAGASQDTLSWVGGQTSVTVLYDLNACDDEAPSGGAEWSSAGLLIRGATLDTSGDLVLAPGTTVADINLLDINTDGTLQGEFVDPDDSLLYTYPQLVNPVNKAKELVVQLGTS